MCFGSTETGSKQTTSTPNPVVQGAAEGNIAFAQGLQGAGYKPYVGDRVAPFTPLQQQGFNLADTVGSGSNPYLGGTENLYANYATAPGTRVNAQPIYSAMGPYMNQYVDQALAPQLAQMRNQFADQNRQLNSTATSSGAFGDARTGIESANLALNQNLSRQGLIGNAYNAAFNTAIGAGAQDVSNRINAQTATGQFNEQALNRQLTGGQAFTGLDQATLARLQSQIGTVQQQGGLQQALKQAQLNVPYSDYQQAQQYPFLTTQLVNSTIGAGATAMPAQKTETTSAPNNAGWALAGSIAPMAAEFALSDIREKEDIHHVGSLLDDTPIFTYKYRGSDTSQIGVIAQDVERRRPDAVVEIGGRKFVNIPRATEMSRMLAETLGQAA